MAVTLSSQDRGEPIDEARPSPRSHALHVCGECRYAQLFAVQPRAVCTRDGSASKGMVLFAGQPACADMSPRAGEELVLSRCASGPEKMHPLFASTPARMH